MREIVVFQIVYWSQFTLQIDCLHLKFAGWRKGRVIIMKKLEIIIKPERLEDLKKILNDCNANGLMISNIMGYGKQKGYVQIYRGTENHVNLLPKVKVETVVPTDIAQMIVDRVVKEINTGNYGDGKIFIYDVDDVVRIRTGERGSDAL
jgi:nitrogen regulatory protein P-II 1